MFVEMFRQLAAYNRWANTRLYASILSMPEDLYRKPTGVFFNSLHGTLNHLLLTDRLWLKRLTGEGEHPNRLDAILYEDRRELAKARIREDARFIDLVGGYGEATLAATHRYHTTSGQPQEQALCGILLHIFNHQTHHRGQAHACCSMLNQEPPSLDLLIFQRGAPALPAVL